MYIGTRSSTNPIGRCLAVFLPLATSPSDGRIIQHSYDRNTWSTKLSAFCACLIVIDAGSPTEQSQRLPDAAAARCLSLSSATTPSSPSVGTKTAYERGKCQVWSFRLSMRNWFPRVLGLGTLAARKWLGVTAHHVGDSITYSPSVLTTKNNTLSETSIVRPLLGRVPARWNPSIN